MRSIYSILLIFACSLPLALQGQVKDSTSRYMNINAIDILYGSSGGGITNTVTVHSTHHFKVNDHFFVGGGFGMDFHIRNITSFPFFVQAGAKLTKTKVSPVIIQDVGYSIGLRSQPWDFVFTEDYVGHGLYASTFAGVHIQTKKRVSFQTGLDYQFQQFKFDYFNFFWEGENLPSDLNIRLHRLGYSFAIVL